MGLLRINLDRLKLNGLSSEIAREIFTNGIYSVWTGVNLHIYNSQLGDDKVCWILQGEVQVFDPAGKIEMFVDSVTESLCLIK